MAYGDDHNRPKRRIWRRLGPRCVFFLFFVVLLWTNLFFLFYLGSIYVPQAWEGSDGRRRRKRAQTMRLTSFGP